MRMIANFGTDWMLIVDESHNTWPALDNPAKVFATRVADHVENGVLRRGVLEGGGPLSVKKLMDNPPRFVLNLSATPGTNQNLEEMDNRETWVELDIRPTHILDPEIVLERLDETEHFANGHSRHDIRTLSQRVLEIVRERSTWGQVIISCITNAQAAVLWSVLKGYGFPSGLLHGEMSTPEKTDVLKQFRAGETDILLGSKMLVEGLDVPSVATVIVPDAKNLGTFLRTGTILEQLGGRAARNVYGKMYLLHTSEDEGDVIRALLKQNEENRRKQESYNEKEGKIPENIRTWDQDAEKVRAAPRVEISPSDRLGTLRVATQITAHLIGTCMLKHTQEPFKSESRDRGGDADMFPANEDFLKRLEQLVLMATIFLIGPARSRHLLDSRKSLKGILAGHSFMNIEDIGEYLSFVLCQDKTRHALRNTREKLRQLLQIFHSLPDLMPLSDENFAEVQRVLLDVLPGDSHSIERGLVRRLFEIANDRFKAEGTCLP
mmetsp:Transcript_66381/g.156289  ORF Transcript_66381/g.156289 Transcript_66381/m.156289 type:complete len:493 (+) Transcript_66381:1018-2496(+)